LTALVLDGCGRVRCVGLNYPFLTLKERDIETGLDYFGARYYSSTQGRFTSPDPMAESARTANPRTFNRYSYTLNNPLRYVDPTGLMDQDPADYRPEFRPCTVGVEAGCSETNTVLASVTINISQPIETTPIDVTPTLNLPGAPRDPEGDTLPEQVVSSPTQKMLELAAATSSMIENAADAVAPDYGYVGFSLPLMAGGTLQFSKDRHLYGSYNFFGYSGGNYNAENLKNWKAGVQFGAAYFATTEMRPADRDAAIQGPGLNATTGPVGGYFPLSGGPSAVTVGWPFTNLGVNISRTHKIF
jgi:RHS repeat-associated protein